MSHDSSDKLKKQKFYLWGFIFTLGLASALGIALLVNISARKQEAKNAYFKVSEITDETEDPAIWGQSFPLQYDGYKKTVDMTRTRYGGSEAVPRKPSSSDPRSITAQSRIEEDPRLKTMWAGYAFAVDFREERGHAYMLDDQTYTERQKVVKQPGTCLHCHASVYTAYKKMGDGDLTKGFEKVNPMPYAEARQLVKHSVACLDCHNPESMELRVTRPGFLEGIRALKEHEGVKNYDVNTQASRQEMRTYVCAQCHVEYYFKGDQKRLVYPWAKGLKVDDIYSYYEDAGHKDWIHAESGAKVLKAQHPEFELWSQGVHAKSGVSCADCHMPYKRVGAMKVSDHHIRSPLLNINRACQTCHKFSEEELKSRAEAIQARTQNLRGQAMDSLVGLIKDIKKSVEAKKTETQIETARNLQRRAQFYLDFVEAENSSGFHAPHEALRVLAESINYSRQGQIVLRDASFKPEVQSIKTK